MNPTDPPTCSLDPQLPDLSQLSLADPPPVRPSLTTLYTDWSVNVCFVKITDEKPFAYTQQELKRKGWRRNCQGGWKDEKGHDDTPFTTAAREAAEEIHVSLDQRKIFEKNVHDRLKQCYYDATPCLSVALKQLEDRKGHISFRLILSDDNVLDTFILKQLVTKDAGCPGVSSGGRQEEKTRNLKWELLDVFANARKPDLRVDVSSSDMKDGVWKETARFRRTDLPPKSAVFSSTSAIAAQRPHTPRSGCASAADASATASRSSTSAQKKWKGRK